MGDLVPPRNRSASDLTVDAVLKDPCRFDSIAELTGSETVEEEWLVRRPDGSLMLIASVYRRPSGTQRGRAYLEAEVRCLSFCDHFAILKYAEDFNADNAVVLLAEAPVGSWRLSRSIARHRANHEPVLYDERDVRFMLLQLCLALQHIHRRCMLHRAVSSFNVHRLPSGLVQLGPFGVTGREALQRPMRDSDLQGIAPELIRGQRYRAKTDMWALGILLYEMMALTRPFRNSLRHRLSMVIDADFRDRLAPLPSCFSPELRELCLALLQPDPDRRPCASEILQRPFVQQVLKDFEAHVTSSAMIDETVKASVKQNIHELTCAAAVNLRPALSGAVVFEGSIRRQVPHTVWEERHLQLTRGNQLLVAAKQGGEVETALAVSTLAAVVPVPWHVSRAEGVFALLACDGHGVTWIQAPSSEESHAWTHHIQTAIEGLHH